MDIYWWTGRIVWGFFQLVTVVYLVSVIVMLVGFTWGAIRLGRYTRRWPQFRSVTRRELDPENMQGLTKDQMFEVVDSVPLKPVGRAEALWIGLVHTWNQMVRLQPVADNWFKIYRTPGASEYLSVSVLGWRRVRPTRRFYGA